MTRRGLCATAAVRKSINLLRRAAPADPTVASEIPCRVTSTPWGMCVRVQTHSAKVVRAFRIERDDDPCVCVRSVGHADAGINSGAPLRSICLRGLNTVTIVANNKLIRSVRDLGFLF